MERIDKRVGKVTAGKVTAGKITVGKCMKRATTKAAARCLVQIILAGHRNTAYADEPDTCGGR